jgi:thioredoxin-dependent peroxiredoxin
MTERTNAITFKGDAMTLVGDKLEAGQDAPSFKLVGTDLGDIALDDFSGKTLVLSVVPSIDTGVCAEQTRRFNEEASSLSDDVVILTVSMDLPFAQDRFCGAEGLDQVQMGSEYKYRSFGEAYGVLIKELGLLTRAVFVVDKQGKVTYTQYVDEVTDEPEYEPVLEAVKALG